MGSMSTGNARAGADIAVFSIARGSFAGSDDDLLEWQKCDGTSSDWWQIEERDKHDCHGMRIFGNCWNLRRQCNACSVSTYDLLSTSTATASLLTSLRHECRVPASSSSGHDNYRHGH